MTIPREERRLRQGVRQACRCTATPLLPLACDTLTLRRRVLHRRPRLRPSRRHIAVASQSTETTSERDKPAQVVETAHSAHTCPCANDISRSTTHTQLIEGSRSPPQIPTARRRSPQLVIDTTAPPPLRRGTLSAACGSHTPAAAHAPTCYSSRSKAAAHDGDGDRRFYISHDTRP